MGVRLLLVLRFVAAPALLVARHARPVAMAVVAAPAAHALGVHAARLERDQLVQLLAHLAVGIVGIGVEELRLEGVEERLPGSPRCAIDAPAVAAAAGREQELGVASHPRVRPAAPARVDVRRARPVARLAAHADLGPASVVGVGGFLVALLETRRVAKQALRVCRHAAVGPVTPIGGRARLAGEEIEPLAALDVVGERQRLEAPGLQRPDVLLDVTMAQGIRKCDVAAVVTQPRSGHEDPTVAYDHRAVIVRARTQGRRR
jgi:hypothetical protein